MCPKSINGLKFGSGVLFACLGSTFRQIPQFEGVIFGTRDDNLIRGMKHDAAHTVKVTPQSVLDVPCLPVILSD